MGSINTQTAELFSSISEGLQTGNFGEKVPVGLTLLGSEHGEAELVKAAEIAKQQDPSLDITLIGGSEHPGFKCYPSDTLQASHAKMEELMDSGEIAGVASLHYNFPVGVSTVGKVITPAFGKEMILSTTTGTSDTDRYRSMLRNTISGIATAKATGIADPKVGLLNIDGASAVVRLLERLKANGYDISFAESARADGGITMRGNDILQGTPDVMVTDPLTGNLFIKVFSSYTTGGGYEAHGYGYGPGVGENYRRLVCIISRASGAPVIANALSFCGECAKRKIFDIYAKEMEAARQAGFEDLLNDVPGAKQQKSAGAEAATVAAPPEKVVNEEIGGIDILEIEDAKTCVWKAGIFAKTGMGCTGPVVLVAGEDLETAKAALKEGNYL